MNMEDPEYGTAPHTVPFIIYRNMLSRRRFWKPIMVLPALKKKNRVLYAGRNSSYY